MSTAPTYADPAERARPEAVPRRVWGATALQVAGRVWGAGCTLAVLWLLAGRLAAEDFGRFTFYLAVFALLDGLVNLGTAQVAVQRTAGDPLALASVLAAARRIRLAAAAVGSLLVGGTAVLLDEPGGGWIWLATLYPFTHALELSITVFKNRIHWRVPVAMRMVASTLSLLFVAGLAAAGETSPAPFLVAVAAGSTMANVGIHWVARRELPRVPAGPLPLREVFVAALPLGLAGLCSQLYFWIDNVYVRAFEGTGPLGLYNVAVRLMSVLLMVAQFAAAAALPWFARRHAAGALGDAVARLGPPLFALAGLGLGALVPWAEPLLELFRPGFGAAASSLRWLLGAAAAVYAGSFLLTAVVASGRARDVLVVTGTGLAVNVLANLWAVPALGIEGAALTTCATECTVAAGAALALVRAGTPPGRGARALTWLGGPLAFALGAVASTALRGALGAAWS